MTAEPHPRNSDARRAPLQQFSENPHPVAAQDFLNLHVAESALD
jgi:hypothetical protein